MDACREFGGLDMVVDERPQTVATPLSKSIKPVTMIPTPHFDISLS